MSLTSIKINNTQVVAIDKKPIRNSNNLIDSNGVAINKVSIPSYKITDCDEYNKILKELYILDLDQSKFYFVYQCRYTHYTDGTTPDRVQIYVYWNDTDVFPPLNTEHFVGLYDVQYSSHINGLIELKNGQSIVGYAVVEVTREDSNDIYKHSLNKDVASKLDFNPYIKNYLSNDQIESDVIELQQDLNNLQQEIGLKLSDIESADSILPPQSEWIADTLVNERGELVQQPNFVGYYVTNLIEVSPNDIIRLAFVRGYWVIGGAMYDENQSFVEAIYGTYGSSAPSVNLDVPFTFVVKNNVKYIRYNIVANAIFPIASQSIIRIKNGSVAYLNAISSSSDGNYFKISQSEVYNKLIKELYILNVEPSKFYYIYQCRYTHYTDGTEDRVQFYIFWNSTQTPPPTTDQYIVGYYDVPVHLHKNGLVELRTSNPQATAYAVIEITPDDTNNVYNQLISNNELVSDLNFSPAISAYFKKNDLQNQINEITNSSDIISLNENVPVNKIILNSYPDLEVDLDQNNVFVRTSYDSENDILIRLRRSNPNNNSIDFSQVFIAPKNTTTANMQTDEYLFHDALDSNPPIPTLNYGYLGGNHGLYTLKLLATGKTKADIGSRYSSSNCGDFILADVDTQNGVMWMHSIIKNDSSHPYPYREWGQGRMPSSSTFTYVSGGVTTTDIVATSMIVDNSCQYPVPTTKKTSMSFELDGEIIQSGHHVGKHLVIYEDYNIIDPETITYYPTMASQPLAKYHLIYEFIGASCTFHADLEAVKDTYLSYFAPIQPVGLQNKGTKKGIFFMPKIKAYKTPILTDNVTGGTDVRDAATLVDINMLPDRAIWGRTNDANDLVHFVNAYASGTSLIHGDGVNALRCKNIPVGAIIHQVAKPINTWCKVYFRQTSNSVLKSGNHINWLAYFAYFKPADNYLMYDVYESDIRVTYIHFTTQVSNLNIIKDFSEYPTVLESSFNDFDIQSGQVVVNSADIGDYLVIANTLL